MEAYSSLLPFEQEAGLLEARLAIALEKVALAWNAGLWESAEPLGLTRTQSHLLLFLDRQPARTWVVGDLARWLEVSPATISEALTFLERKGHIQRSSSPQDRRKVRVSLTSSGRALAEELSRQNAFWVQVLSSLTGEEKRALLRALVKVIRGLQEQGRIRVARMCVTCAFFRPQSTGDPQRPHYCEFARSAFAEGFLRVDCSDYQLAEPDREKENWLKWVAGVDKEG
jgi:DNA-binding MarR family transcriptional regulator